jgi:signal transduction histidine kinase/FixJ family two-component response regulator
MLTEAKVRSAICTTLGELVAGLRAGAGFALVTEEALHAIDLHPLAEWIAGQPEWSDFPFVLLTQRGGGIERNPAALRFLSTLGSVTFLERPFHPTSLVSLVQSAIRGRRRQYDARARLHALADLNATLEARVTAAIAEHKLLADIVESTDTCVQVVDPDFRYVAINRSGARDFEQNFGVRPKVGDSVVDLIHDRPEVQANLKALWSRALAGEAFTEVVRLTALDGRTRHYEMKFNTLYGHGGHRIGAYQFGYDVTTRFENQEKLVKAETALRQAQKMEAVGQLTGGVAHDFNNLLMAFSSGMFLLDQPMDADRRRKVVDSMRQAISRGTALTRQLLAFSRSRPLAARTLDLRAQLLGMHEMLQRSLRGNMEVKMDFEKGLWPVEVDPGELELAILNICVNSRDAMTDGGVIRIAARNSAAGHGRGPSDAVVVSIADSGVGMTQEVLARAFEPFFTTKEVGKGSGLGLAQVYGFLAQSNGAVSIDSEPGKGTTVALTFPRSRNPVAAHEREEETVAAQSAAGERRSRPRARVLLVEDDLTVAELTRQLLESIGMAVLHAASAGAALSALLETGNIDIVFSDVMMPGGMSGTELAREIRKRYPKLPVVLTTGYIEAARSAVREGLEVLVKPYTLEELARTLTAHLARRAAAAS